MNRSVTFGSGPPVYGPIQGITDNNEGLMIGKMIIQGVVAAMIVATAASVYAAATDIRPPAPQHQHQHQEARR